MQWKHAACTKKSCHMGKNHFCCNLKVQSMLQSFQARFNLKGSQVFSSLEHSIAQHAILTNHPNAMTKRTYVSNDSWKSLIKLLRQN